MKHLKYIPVFALAFTLNLYGKNILHLFEWNDSKEEITAPVSDTGSFGLTEDSPILFALDSLVNAPYFALCSSCEEENGYHAASDTNFPRFSDEVYKDRLQLLNHNTPFKLVFNQEVKYFIDLYANKKRWTTSKVLGMSDVYFPIFESMLDKYNLPLEFKYLAVVESALNPTAKSKAGALGLWQFMLPTGKSFDLEVSSFEDQRSDPYKSTEAACKYFTYLYEIYNNWELVLAAYNCGPGNVNKAIRRSGNKRNYWELWPYLPKETRGYVPAFIAVNYIMNYAKEHAIKPTKPITAFFEFDTLIVRQRLDLNRLAENLNISAKLLHILNPSFKHQIIPENEQGHTLCLPINKIGLFIENEAKLFALSKEKTSPSDPYEETTITHYVGKGDGLTKLTKIYGCTTQEIIEWNQLKDTTLAYDQKVIVGYLGEKSKKMNQKTPS